MDMFLLSMAKNTVLKLISGYYRTVGCFHPMVFTFINYPSNGIKTANGQEATDRTGILQTTMKHTMFFITAIAASWLCSCQSKTTVANHRSPSITRDDSIAIVQMAVMVFDSTWENTFKDQHLRIVKGSVFKSPLPIVSQGRQAEFVDFDSVSRGFFAWNQPKFYVNIQVFQIKDDNTVLVEVRFRSTGDGCNLMFKRNNDRWYIHSKEFFVT
jgi:hypothetical protein